MAENTMATAAIAGVVGLVGALAGLLANVLAARAETRRKNWEYQMKRRSERQEAYLAAIDLLTDWQWQQDDPTFDVVKDFSVKFVRAASRVRVYGSPASIAAMDDIQNGLAMLNRARDKSESESADAAIGAGLDRLVIAATADVGPHGEDNLGKKVGLTNLHLEGAGPRA
jgi:hypothetical protein